MCVETGAQGSLTLHHCVGCSRGPDSSQQEISLPLRVALSRRSLFPLGDSDIGHNTVVSHAVRPHRRQPSRLPCPWDSPGKNTGVGCHFLLQCMKVKSESEVTQSCPTLRDPMDCSPPGSSVHGIFQARGLGWGASALSDGKARVGQTYIQYHV